MSARVFCLASIEINADSDLTPEQIREVLESVRYPNRCMVVEPRVIEYRRVEDWHDGHPLNRKATHEAAFRELFGLAPEYGPDQDMAERLREKGWDDGYDVLLLTAADLIDKLRAEVASLRAEVERLRAVQS